MAKTRFLRMQHECFDALAVLPMTNDERRVMMVVIRYTVGFHRYDAELSNRFIAAFLGDDVTEQHVGYCIKRLCDKGYLKIISRGIGTHPRKLCFCYSEFRGRFRDVQRKISDSLEEDFDTARGRKLSSKESKEEKKNKKVKIKKDSQANSFSLSDSDEQERERELTDEEWYELHKNDPWDDEEGSE